MDNRAHIWQNNLRVSVPDGLSHSAGAVPFGFVDEVPTFAHTPPTAHNGHNNRR